MNIKIKYHTDIQKIGEIENGDWIDLRAAEDVFIRQGGTKRISLGVSMQLPEGYEAHIMPRSSTFKKWGIIMTGSGIIDNSYCGDNDILKFEAYCLEAKDVVKKKVSAFPYEINVAGTKIHKGDRICQFRVMKKMPELQFEEVESLGNPDRGGFGSTGVN